MRTRTRSARHRTHGTLFGLCAALALAAAWPAYADIEITMPAFTLSHKVKWSRSGCAEGGLMFLEGAGGFAVRDVNLGGGFIGNPVGTRIADDELLLQYVLPRGKIFKTQAAVVSANTEPFALSGGETLTVRVDRGALQTITFAASDFATPGAATAAEVAARIAADLTGGLATANGGAVELRSATEGTASFIEVTGGSANAALGFPTAEAQGSENTVYAEYQYVYQPYLTRPPYVQLSTRIGYARTVIRTLAPVLGTFTAPVSGDITTGHDLILDDLHRVRVEIETTAPDIPLAYLSSIMRETVDGNLYCYTSGIGGSADPLYPASTDSANAGPFDLSAALPLTLTVRMNSAPEQTLTFTTADFADPAAATAAEIVAAINRQLVGGYASTIAYGTKVRLTSHSGAATSGIEVTGGGMNAFLGFTTAFVQGAPRTNPPDPTRVGIGHVYTTEIDPGTGAVTWRYVGYNYLIPGRDYRIGSGGMGFEDGVRAQYSGCYDYQDGVLLDGPGGNPITSTTLTAVPCGETQLYYRIEAPVPPPTGVIEASAELVPDAGDIAAGTGPRLSSWWAYFGRSPVDSSNPDYNTVMISRSGYTTVPAADGGLSPASVVFDGCMPEARYGFATARGSGGYPGLLGQGYGALLLDWPNDPSYPAFVTPIGPKYTSSVAFPANNDFAYITPLFDTPGINSPHGGVYPDGAIILHSDAPPPHTADSPKEIEQWHFRAEMAYLSGEVGLTGCVQTSEILMGTVHWLGVAGPSASYVDEAGVLRTYTTGNYGASGIGRMQLPAPGASTTHWETVVTPAGDFSEYLYNFYVERPADPGSNEEPLRQVLQVAPRLAADGSARTITVPGPGRANEVVLAPVTFNTSSVRISMRVLNERREDPPGSGNFLDVLRPFTAPELWFEAGTPYTGNGAALGGTGHDGTFNGYSVGDTSGLDDESLRKTVHTLRIVGLGGANDVTVHARARVPVNADGTGPVAYTSFPDVTGLSFPDTAGCVDTCVVLATDPAGNQQQYTFIDDATPPVVVLDPPLPASITGAELQIAGTADDGNPLTLTVAVDGVEVIGLASPLDVQPGHLAFDRTLCLAAGVHEIVITAADTCGNATTSTYTVEATGCPANPSTGLAATVQPGGVQLSWDPVSGASGYLVFRSVDGAAFGTSPYATVSAPPFVDTAVAAGHSYSYTITSISDGSTGGPLCPTGCGTSEAVTATVGGVAGRYVFYENSAWDTTSDDDAIAPDKTALLPGNRASFANYTSYSRGINGIIIDLVNLPSASLAASDFEFRTGNDNNPDGWALANAPASIRVVQGAGAGGSDRVYLTWSDASAVKRAWLQVRVKAGARTGLLADDVFYFGNAIGEVGDSGWHALVNATDATATMANQRSPFSPAAIDDPYDHNRDRKVNATDVSIVQSNYTTFFNMLRLIQP